MFEALFILTTIDAGTRVGRFMFQELAGHVWKPLGRLSWYPSILFSSAVVVAGWGYFVYQGVIDPLGGINSLWPLFGIANQLLAAIALCVSTTIIIKMGKMRYAWVTLAPLVWLSVGDADRGLAEGVLAGSRRSASCRTRASLANSTSPDAARLIFNDNLDAALSIFFMLVVVVVILASAREWYLVAVEAEGADA